MQKEKINPELSAIAFNFFYWFSRFEFALKENGYLKTSSVGDRAMPGWKCFTERWKDSYKLSNEARELIELAPEIQVVGQFKNLEWEKGGYEKCGSDLEKVVLAVKTIRNNLFHGGKHGGEGWDCQHRNFLLLKFGQNVLDQLAQLGSFECDYTQYY